MSAAQFSINPSLDPKRLRAKFALSNRIHIADFLAAQQASQLHSFLAQAENWKLVVNSDDKVFELDRHQQAHLSPDARLQLQNAIHAQARYGFQYCYESIRVPDADRDRKRNGSLIDEFARFLSQKPALDFFRTLLDDPTITFADAQATAYGPGHFLTAHDDNVAGKNRRAAFVMNLSQEWSVDWGGLLAFHQSGKPTVEAYVPSFNAINIFAVPQIHSVTMVAPFVPRRRYSITGWLRSGKKP